MPKFYVTAHELNTYEVIIEAESLDVVEEYVKSNEDFMVSTLKEHRIFHDLGEVLVRECPTDEEVAVNFSI